MTPSTSLLFRPAYALQHRTSGFLRKTNRKFTLEGTMLAELFVLRMEAIARSTNPQGANNSDTRFVPIKLSTPVTKNSPTATTKNG